MDSWLTDLILVALPTRATSGWPPLLRNPPPPPPPPSKNSNKCIGKLTSPLLNSNFFRHRGFEWIKTTRIKSRKGKKTITKFSFGKKIFFGSKILISSLWSYGLERVQRKYTPRVYTCPAAWQEFQNTTCPAVRF